VSDVLSISSQFLKRAKWIFVAELIVRVFKILCGLLIIRLLSPSDFGMYSVLFAAVTMFSFLLDPGINTLVLKKFPARQRYVRFFKSFLKLKLLFLVIGALCFLVAFFLNIAPGSSIIDAIGMLSLVVLNELAAFFFTILRARNSVQSEVLLRFSHGFLTLILLSVLFFNEASLLLVLLAQVLPWVLIMPFLWRVITVKWPDAASAIPNNINSALVRRLHLIVVFQMAVAIWSTSELLIAAQLFSSEQLGFYGAALRIFTFALLPSAVLATTLLPQLSESGQQAKVSIWHLWGSLGNIYLVCLILSAMLILLQSHNLILILIGIDYLEAKPVLMHLAWRLVPASIFAIATSVLMAYGEFRTLIKIYVFLFGLVLISVFSLSNIIDILRMVDLITLITLVGAWICVVKVLNLSKSDRRKILFNFKDVSVVLMTTLFLFLSAAKTVNPYLSLLTACAVLFFPALYLSRSYKSQLRR
jgi:O-antigen/teichoic acid export membrane protein